MIQEYGFDEVYLKHKKGVVGSRQEDCDPSVEFGGKKFKLPIVPANMRSVVDKNTCVYLADRGLFYIMHRFKVDAIDFVDYMQEKEFYASISTGVNEDSRQELKELKDNKLYPEYITIDIANAHSTKGEYMTKFVKDLFPKSFLIVGNYASEDAVVDLEEWGADATKCGISNGSVCTTYHATGFSRPQFSAVLECAKVAKKPIISDGAIKHVGDINKAMVAGATMVMAGGMFSGYYESAGDTIDIKDERFKLYFGSASYNNMGRDKNVEGTCIPVKLKGSMDDIIEEVDDGVRSGISYAGGKDLSAFNTVEWGVRIGGVRQ